MTKEKESFSKKMMLKILNTLFIVLFFSLLAHAQSNKLKTIVIDAGHGGKDPGTAHGTQKEKNIALAITLKLGKKLEEELSDVKIIYTRKTDVFIPLAERANIANKHKADLFICVHVNANPYNSKIKGSEIFVLGLHKSDDNLEVEKRENSVTLLEDQDKKSYKNFDPNSPIAHIMMANYQAAFMQTSLKLASKVDKQIGKIGHKNRGVKQAGFQVLWQTSMPGIYIETGYLTNATDRALLTSENGQEKFVDAVVKAIKSYQIQQESN